MDMHPPVKQKPAIVAMAAQLEISLVHLRRDECGDWSLLGRFGRVYSTASGFLIIISGWAENDAPWLTARGWNNCKKDMEFMTLKNDGDEDGAFMFDRLPTASEASLIRKYVGLRKKKNVSEEMLERLKTMREKQKEENE